MSGFEYSGDDVLDVMSRFAKNRNKEIENLIAKSFALNHIQQPSKILEFGAGKGEFINRFSSYNNLITYAVDLDDNYHQLLKQKHKAYKSITSLPEKVDFIYAIDVLEHIENDINTLKDLHAALQNKGKVLIYVPARPELYSNFDKRIGHYRRYTLTELKQKALMAGFTIDFIKYHDFLGYFAAYYNKFFFKDNGRLEVRAVKVYDQFLVPLSSLLEKILKNPFIGKDILLLATK